MILVQTVPCKNCFSPGITFSMNFVMKILKETKIGLGAVAVPVHLILSMTIHPTPDFSLFVENKLTRNNSKKLSELMVKLKKYGF